MPPATSVDRPAHAWLGRSALVVAASFVIGGLESWAQGALPDILKPLANSASGFTLVTALLVFWSAASPRLAAFLGAISFVLLNVGYAVVSTARGYYYYPPVMWGAVGIVVGPFVGVAASWLRHRGVLARGLRPALAGGLLAGIGLGDAIFGLARLADTTGAGYWIGVGCLALALLAYLLARRVRGVAVVVLLGLAVAVAAAMAAAFSLL